MTENSIDIEAIAALARLAIDPADRGEFAQDLARILALVEQMGAADTAGVAPMANPHDELARLRPDEVTETDQWAAFAAIAPQTEAGLYLVPRVIE